MPFAAMLKKVWKKNNSLVCVGLDTTLDKIPLCCKSVKYPRFEFNKSIVDATADLVCCYKPQIAYYGGEAAENELEMTISYIKEMYSDIPVILDAKRGDIGATAEMYAMEAFLRFGADAVTVNPYMGGDTLKPFLDYREKGVVVLCRTSNPGSGDFQNLEFNGRKLYQIVAEKAANEWNTNKNILLVVGATYPEELADIRSIAGNIPLLVPGVGAQGGSVEMAVKNGKTANGFGMIINSSRGIIYASGKEDFAEKARTETLKLRDEINLYR